MELFKPKFGSSLGGPLRATAERTGREMPKNQLTISYAALGLLPSIPLPTGASSSTTHRAPINLPSSASEETEEVPKVSYGRIIRDEQGNVIDIILDEEEDQGMKDGGEEVEGALNPAKEWVPERVEAKTDVVRCKSFHVSFSVHTSSLSPFNGIFTVFDSIEDGKQISLNHAFTQLPEPD